MEETSAGFYPICPICELPIISEFDMHEVLLTRGDISGAENSVKLAIHVPQNCVLVHLGPCHLEAQHKESGKERCIKQIIKWEGLQNVQFWLDGMDRKTTSGSVGIARRLVDLASAVPIPVGDNDRLETEQDTNSGD